MTYLPASLILFQEIVPAVLPLAIALATSTGFTVFLIGVGLTFGIVSVFVALQTVQVNVFTPSAVVVASFVTLPESHV